MPIIVFEGPKLNTEKKREMISSLTDAAHKVIGQIPKESYIVILKENTADNIGSGGVMLSDKLKTD